MGSMKGSLIPNADFQQKVRSPVLSKSWLSIATSPSFIKVYTEHNRFARQTLMITNHDSYTDLDLTAGIHLRELPPLEMLNSNSMLISCDGLILFWCIPMRRHCIINPLTGHFYIMPRIICSIDGFLVFNFHRPSSEYRILASLDFDISCMNAVGKGYWRRIRDRRPAFVRNSISVHISISLYWLAWNEPPDENDNFSNRAPPDTTMTFDEEAEVYNLLPLPPPKELGDRGGYLMNFNGELGLWFISENGIIDFWIMKESRIKRYSVFHTDLVLFPKTVKSKVWEFGSTISIKDEELLISAYRPLEKRFLIRWNFKTATYLVENLTDYAENLWIQFPYVEVLTLSGHSLHE